jgi:beta-barrel assembly-enhancing protease
VRAGITVLIFAVALTTAAVGLAAPKPADIAGYRLLVDQDLRLATIGYRLAYANRSFCSQTERNPGFVLHDILQYPNADTARAAFGFVQPVAVSAVVPGGPAERAGIVAGDGLVAWSDTPWNWANWMPKNGYDRIASVKAMIQESLRTSPVVGIELQRQSVHKTLTLSPPEVCASDFQIDTVAGKDAGADGHMVSVSLPLARYAADDDEFAAIVAHELSHNILGHRARLDTAKLGNNRRAVLATEIEADRLSVWLMANAAYDPKAAVRFAQRCRKDSCLGLFTDGMHPGWKKRAEIMDSEIVSLDSATKLSGLAVPPLLMQTIRNSN